MKKHLILSRIRTPDGTILTSYHVHDYVTHTDKSRLTFFLDGGNEYQRYGIGFDPLYVDLADDEIKYIEEKGIYYCPTSGRFYDKKGNLKDTAIGKQGYRHVYIIDKTYKAHRLVFMFSGISNVKEVDHIDGDRGNNIWTNLRASTKSENQANAKTRIDNSSGVKGLCFHKKKNSWVGRVQKDNKRYEVANVNKDIVIEKMFLLRNNLHEEFSNHGTRRSDFNGFFKDLSIYSDAPFEVIRENYHRGGRGKDGLQPLTWVPLSKMSNEWLKNCIKYNDDRGIKNCDSNYWYNKELRYRKRMEIFIED